MKIFLYEIARRNLLRILYPAVDTSNHYSRPSSAASPHLCRPRCAGPRARCARGCLAWPWRGWRPADRRPGPPPTSSHSAAASGRGQHREILSAAVSLLELSTKLRGVYSAQRRCYAKQAFKHCKLMLNCGTCLQQAVSLAFILSRPSVHIYVLAVFKLLFSIVS